MKDSEISLLFEKHALNLKKSLWRLDKVRGKGRLNVNNKCYEITNKRPTFKEREKNFIKAENLSRVAEKNLVPS
jgi:hypothetical protein